MMSGSAPVVRTSRLDLIAATSESARAAAGSGDELSRLLDADRLSQILNARIPPQWPPRLMADALDPFARRLEDDPSLAGWLMWFIVRRDGRVLIGSGGFGGLPDKDGSIVTGYSILDDYQGNGYATEALCGLVGWALQDQRVRKIRADTYERLAASIRVLEKNGFALVGRGRAGKGPEAGMGRRLTYELIRPTAAAS